MFFRRLFINPLFGGFNTIIGVLAGYFGSHFDKEIFYASGRLYLPPEWTGGTLWIPGTFTLVPVFFWLLVITFGVGFTGTFWAQGAASAEVNGEIQSALKKLFTLPSRGFLESYRSSALVSNKLSLNIMNSISLPDLELAIRAQLEAICKVVSEYDNDSRAAIYGCNVMLYLGSSTPKFAAKLSTVQTSIRCIETGVALSNLAGVLELQLPLSVCSSTGRNPDGRLTPLALPLPLAGPFDELKYIPGAPLAFAAREARVYRNQTDLIEKVDSNRGFSLTVVNDLVAILDGQADSVQGLLCIPLFDYFASAPTIAVGVLNIHKSRSDVFIEEKFTSLEPLIAPLVQNLERLVSLYP